MRYNEIMFMYDARFRFMRIYDTSNSKLQKQIALIAFFPNSPIEHTTER